VGRDSVVFLGLRFQIAVAARWPGAIAELAASNSVSRPLPIDLANIRFELDDFKLHLFEICIRYAIAYSQDFDADELVVLIEI
jgi:hypothetical protein